MMILRNPKTDERVVTNSRDGYPGWKLVRDNVDEPLGHGEHQGSKWQEDKERGRQENVEDLKAEIAELRTRIAKLEGKTE